MVCSDKVKLAISVAKTIGLTGRDSRLTKVLNDPGCFSALAEVIHHHPGTQDAQDALQALAIFAQQSPDAMESYRAALGEVRGAMIEALRNPGDSQMRYQSSLQMENVYELQGKLPMFGPNDLAEHEKDMICHILRDFAQKGADSEWAGMRPQVFMAATAGLGDPLVRETLANYVRSGRRFDEDDIAFFGRSPQSAEVLLAVADNGEPLTNGSHYNDKLNAVAQVFAEQADESYIPAFAEATRNLTPNQCKFYGRAFNMLQANKAIKFDDQKLTPIYEAATEEYGRMLNERNQTGDPAKLQGSDELLYVVGRIKKPSPKIREFFKARLLDWENTPDHALSVGIMLYNSRRAPMPKGITNSLAMMACRRPSQMAPDLRGQVYYSLMRAEVEQTQGPKDFPDEYVDIGLGNMIEAMGREPAKHDLWMRDDHGEPAAFKSMRESGLLEKVKDHTCPHVEAAFEKLLSRRENPAPKSIRAWINVHVKDWDADLDYFGVDEK